MASDYDEAAREFDNEIVPPDLSGQSEIDEWMGNRYGDNENVPDGLIDEIVPRIAEKRGKESDAGIQGGGAYYDPTVGQFRDGDTGQFISGDNA